MVGVREKRVEGVQVIRAKAPESITHDYLDSRKACALEVEAKWAVNVDASHCLYVSYSAWIKVICTARPTGVVDILGGVELGVVEEKIA